MQAQLISFYSHTVLAFHGACRSFVALNVPDRNGTFRIDVPHCTNINVQLWMSTQVRGIMTLQRNRLCCKSQFRVHFMSIDDNYTFSNTFFIHLVKAYYNLTLIFCASCVWVCLKLSWCPSFFFSACFWSESWVLHKTVSILNVFLNYYFCNFFWLHLN